MRTVVSASAKKTRSTRKIRVHGRSSETKMGGRAAFVLAFAFIASCQALDNGLGITPPRGWRSWDAFENSVNQTRQQSQVDELVWRVVGDRAVWSEQELIAKLEARYGARMDLDPDGDD